MRYAGKREVVEAIEQEIRKNTKYFEYRRKKPKEQFNLSVVKTKIFDIFAVEDYFTVEFLYDGRDGTARVDIMKDKNMGWFIKISPKILLLLAQLEFQIGHKNMTVTPERRQMLLKGKQVEMKPKAQPRSVKVES